VHHVMSYLMLMNVFPEREVNNVFLRVMKATRRASTKRDLCKCTTSMPRERMWNNNAKNANRISRFVVMRDAGAGERSVYSLVELEWICRGGCCGALGLGQTGPNL